MELDRVLEPLVWVGQMSNKTFWKPRVHIVVSNVMMVREEPVERAGKVPWRELCSKRWKQKVQNPWSREHERRREGVRQDWESAKFLF